MKSRLDRIEATLEKIAQVQLHNQELLSTLMTSVSAFVDSSNAYVADSKARTAQLEASLDALLRAITQERKIGKGHI